MTSIAARLDRMPLFSMHRRLAVVVGIGTFFDLYDIFLGGVLAAVLAEEWDLGTNGKALVIASGFAGMFLGAITFGSLADRFGRRKMFLINLFVYSGFSLLAATSPSLAWLAVFRFLSGLGLGGELTLADTYLSELLPNRVRGRYIAWAYTFGFVGVPLAAFVGAKFVADTHLLMEGWRWLLVIGGLGAAIVWALRRSLPESPRWHEIRGDREAAEAGTRAIEEAAMRDLGLRELPAPEESVAPERRPDAGFGEIFSPDYRRRSTMLFIFQALQTVGYYGFGTLAPLVLASKGFEIVETLGYSAVIFLGYPLGSAVSIVLVERYERKALIIASALAMAVLGLIFGSARTPWLIITSGFLITAVSNVFSNGFHIYQAEIFPTHMRATAVGAAYSLSRLTGAILPFVSVALLDGLGATAVFAASAAILVLLAIDVAVLGPRSTGRTLEHINEAREGEQRRGSGRFERSAAAEREASRM